MIPISIFFSNCRFINLSHSFWTILQNSFHLLVFHMLLCSNVIVHHDVSPNGHKVFVNLSWNPHGWHWRRKVHGSLEACDIFSIISCDCCWLLSPVQPSNWRLFQFPTLSFGIHEKWRQVWGQHWISDFCQPDHSFAHSWQNWAWQP